MKKLIGIILTSAMLAMFLPIRSMAAGGIYASGGGTVTVGQSFTVNVTASGATFDTVSGAISVSGPVSITSFSAGDATWINKPSDGGAFNGAFLGDKKSSFTVATIKLKATGVGNGAVTVSGASLKNAGAVVGSGSGSASFTVQKAPDLPGKVTVSSSSHPDQNAAYEATTIALSWNKDSGVDGFSYLLDQAADTTPASKITDANTSATYADKAVGTYYFHIKAHKADGWGGSTHFKINIKEPDAKIDATLSAPKDIEINKDSSFINNLTDGTVTGIIISGSTEPGFTANITLTPAPTIPEGKTLTAKADDQGKFSLLIDFPIISGFHKLAIQGQNNKILTPVSNEVKFEISQAKGGSVNTLTDADINAPTPVKAESTDSSGVFSKTTAFYGILILFVLIIVILAVVFLRKNKRNKGILSEITKK